MTETECPVCHVSFFPRRREQESCSRSCAGKLREQRIKPIRKLQLRVSDEQVKAAVDDINAGSTWAQAMSTHGVAERTIQARADLRGWPMRKGLTHRVKARTIRDDLLSEDCAYLAALVDGEGTISLIAGKGSPAGIVWIFNTHIPLMEWLATLGGTVVERPMSSLGTKPSFAWKVVRRADTLALLTMIRPYMRIKGDKADAVIAALAPLSNGTFQYPQLAETS